MRVCVYAICKNEEQFVERWVESMKEADVIIVLDTGSTDKTVKKLREKGVIVYEEVISPWRFDVARNKSLAHVPRNVDVCVCTDLDEVLNKGWRAALERDWQPTTTQGRYLYNWSMHPDGSPDVQFEYLKIHKRQGFYWTYPVHEILKYRGKQTKETFLHDVILTHYPDETKSRTSYLPLLEMAVKENPQDDRMTYYLGREYMYQKQYVSCVKTLTQYLGLKSAIWDEERSAAMRLIARSYEVMNQKEEAYGWYYRAIAQCPHMRESYVECAKYAYVNKEFEVCFFMISQALKIKEKSSTYVNMGYAWDHTPHDLMAISSYYLGLFDQAYEHAKKALVYAPKNKRLQDNLHLIENKIKK